ncbi:hypothetical protein KY306_02310 [Candidatus Woesearchaeota archaeon]|nr:hypothetical protein [Candidatus Woesearchaeota archaeon]
MVDHYIPAYFIIAQMYQDSFRSILRHIKKNVVGVPKDFDPEMPLADFFEKFSPLDRSLRNRIKFYIFDFQKGPLEHELGTVEADEFLIGYGNNYFDYEVVTKYKLMPDGTLTSGDCLYSDMEYFS